MVFQLCLAVPFRRSGPQFSRLFPECISGACFGRDAGLFPIVIPVQDTFFFQIGIGRFVKLIGEYFHLTYAVESLTKESQICGFGWYMLSLLLAEPASAA